MGACASKTNEQIEETNMENDHEAGFTSPVHEPMQEYHDQVVDGVVDEVLPQQIKSDLNHESYEVVENVTGNVDPISHLDAEYQNAGFTVTENPVTHIMVREGVYMNKQTNEILYDTAVFPNGAEDVAQPMDPVPARGHDADTYDHMPAGNNYDYAPAHPVSYDDSFAPEQAAFAPEHAAAQENNLMVGVAMQQAAPQTQLEEPAAQPDEVPPPEAEQEAEPEHNEPVAENKKRRKKKSKKSRGWGW